MQAGAAGGAAGLRTAPALLADSRFARVMNMAGSY